MTKNILPPIYHIASELDSEAVTLKTGLGLIYDTLQFDTTDQASIIEAQGRLFFLVEVIEGIQKRLESLAAEANAVRIAEKAEA